MNLSTSSVLGNFFTIELCICSLNVFFKPLFYCLGICYPVYEGSVGHGACMEVKRHSSPFSTLFWFQGLYWGTRFVKQAFFLVELSY